MCLLTRLFGMLLTFLIITGSEPSALKNFVAEECLENVGGSKVILSDEQKYKDFLACTFKRQGFMSSDGKTIDFDKMKLVVSRFYHESELGKLQACKESVKANSASNLASNALDCIISVIGPLTPK